MRGQLPTISTIMSAAASSATAATDATDVIAVVTVANATNSTMLRRSPRLAEKAASLAKKAASLADAVQQCMDASESESEEAPSSDSDSDSDSDSEPALMLSKEENDVPPHVRAIRDNFRITQSHIINMLPILLDKVHRAEGPEHKTTRAVELLQFLIYNPMILAYHPPLRKVVRDKMAEFRTIIAERNTNFPQELYSYRNQLRCAFEHVTHKGIQTELICAINRIDNLYEKYREWQNSTDLTDVMDKLEKTMDALVHMPDYVA